MSPSPDQSSSLKKLVGALAVTTVGFAVATIVLATNGSDEAAAPAVAPAPVENTVPVDTASVPSPTPPPSTATAVVPEETAPVVETEVVTTAPPTTKPPTTEEPSTDPLDVEVPVEEPAATPETGEFAFLELKSESSFYNVVEDNVCAGAKLAFDNKLCVDLNAGQPQAGANVTKGYVGDMDVGELKPNDQPYMSSSMCPVNVHWHLGAEHYSVGEYDEVGDGPHGGTPLPDWANRDLASGEVRDGFRCRHFDAKDEKFTKPYEWKHCEGMEVGETYEVHWPHSAAGDCGTPNQYQSPFYDGVFCNLPLEAFLGLSGQQIANAVGVHGQVFTIVNDESYYYGDMIRGMVMDKSMGQDLAIYSGSTTGTSRDNEFCSQYAPITWQVDRKCHMISASSFDKMCFDMKMQRDDMSSDLHAHGARELVNSKYVANNQYDSQGPHKEEEPVEVLAAEELPVEAPAVEDAAEEPPVEVAAEEPAAEDATPVVPAQRNLRALAEAEDAHADDHADDHDDAHDMLPSFLDLKAGSSFYDTAEDNACAGAKLAFDNKLCAELEVQPQAGANVTKGYVGNMDVGELKPNTNSYMSSSMCPVNVHWHLGSEHYSAGEYDEGGNGPHGNQARPEWADRARALASGEVRDGFRCRHYDAEDEKFTKPYEWKHCEGMEVGETYEVHWPHSAVGACGTVNQYQTPFYDGVFCNLPLDAFLGLSGQQIANAVGVHGQVFTIVNDEEYFYSDMIRGMVTDGDMGADIAIYTGSTTGTSRNNQMCSQYAPITWQVDRKCHMISASSFDKMCYDMKMQRDDMSGDLHAHGARELVHHDYASNNHHVPETGLFNDRKKMLRA